MYKNPVQFLESDFFYYLKIYLINELKVSKENRIKGYVLRFPSRD